MSLEPGLRFFLRYVEAHGAVVLEGEDEALLQLPPDIQGDLSLPAELAVTSDSEMAQEGGQMLVIAGHPLLQATAERVLKHGDAGFLALEWPRSTPPAPNALLDTLREFYPVEHGRIDLAGEPEPVYAPLLRIGSLVSFSGEGHFLERIEAVFDAVEGLPIDAAAEQRILTASNAQATAQCAVLAPRIPFTLTAGLRELDQRANGRAAELQSGAKAAMEEELRRAADYYRAQLAQIGRRRERAAPERQELYDEQAKVTAEEAERRRREILEKHRVSGRLRPFRLHLLLAPALRLALEVRRGERSYPLGCTYLLDAQTFLPVRCPSCGYAAPLVAGRKALGCQRCQTTKEQGGGSASLPRGEAAGTPDGKMPKAADGVQVAREAAAAAVAQGSGSEGGRPKRRPGGLSSSGARESGATGRHQEAKARETARAGIAVTHRAVPPGWQPVPAGALAFFRQVLGGQPSPVGVARHSPLDLALRWFSWRGLHIVLGLNYPAEPDGDCAVRNAALVGGHHLQGRLKLGRQQHDFTLFTVGSAQELTLWEVVPVLALRPDQIGAIVKCEMPPGLDEYVQHHSPPAGLDEVEWLLLERGAPQWHLTFVLRAASLWRLAGRRLPGISPRAAASALLELAFAQSWVEAPEGAAEKSFGSDPLRSRQAREAIARHLPRVVL